MKQLDKKGWKKVRFGEVCRNLNVTVKSPQENGYVKVIGLENIESGSLHIKTWGDIADGTTFTKTFEPGHVLFGKRRAYLKKAAVAEFKGLCSGDILVFEAIEKVLHPKLLPFIVSSDRFFEFAVKTSAGSLSPRTKFQDLVNFEFSLPPIDQQEKLAELLWAGDDLNQKKLQEIHQIRFTHSIIIDNLIFEHDFKYMPIKDIAVPELKGFVDGDWIESKDQSNSGIRLIQLADIGVRSFINKSRRYISEETLNKLKCFELFSGDILIARMPDPIGRSCILPEINFRAITAVDVCIIRPNLKYHNPKYWAYVFNTGRWFNLMNQFASGTTRSRVSKKNLEMIEMPTPSLNEQNIIVNKLNSFEIVIGYAEDDLNKIRAIQFRLINSLFD